ncbi:hypothetical protein HID58_095768, partial [Brassica napus]
SEWCVLSLKLRGDEPNGATLLSSSVSVACQLADCTSLGPGSSCAGLDSAANASYAFNMYFQKMDHRRGSCVFNNLGVASAEGILVRVKGRWGTVVTVAMAVVWAVFY